MVPETHNLQTRPLIFFALRIFLDLGAQEYQVFFPPQSGEG